MEKNKIKYIVDLGLLISFLLVAITGIIKYPGFFKNIFNISLNYKDPILQKISSIHDWSGIAIVVLVLIHLIMNWNWIIGMTKHFFKHQNLSNKKLS